MTRTQSKILEALEGKAASVLMLAETLGYATANVITALNILKARGDVTESSDGLFRISKK